MPDTDLPEEPAQTIPDAAGALGVSERTLRRLLAENADLGAQVVERSRRTSSGVRTARMIPDAVLPELAGRLGVEYSPEVSLHKENRGSPAAFLTLADGGADTGTMEADTGNGGESSAANTGEQRQDSGEQEGERLRSPADNGATVANAGKRVVVRRQKVADAGTLRKLAEAEQRAAIAETRAELLEREREALRGDLERQQILTLESVRASNKAQDRIQALEAQLLAALPAPSDSSGDGQNEPQETPDGQNTGDSTLAGVSEPGPARRGFWARLFGR